MEVIYLIPPSLPLLPPDHEMLEPLPLSACPLQDPGSLHGWSGGALNLCLATSLPLAPPALHVQSLL